MKNPKHGTMKKLFIDIETSPHIAYIWKLFDENVSLDQLITPTRVISVAWKFDGDKTTSFAAEWHRGGHRAMIDKVYKAINKADVIVHYNGTSFDEPHLNREFLEAGFNPPSMPDTVDLYQALGRKFRFASKKLQHAADVLKLRQGKIRTDFTLWSRVLDKIKEAQEEMERYNREDVELTEALYHRVLPWIDKHPNAALYENDKDPRCTHCASNKLVKDGFQRTSSGAFQRYRCNNCGARSRVFKRNHSTPLRESK